MQKYFNIVVSVACIILAVLLLRSCKKNEDADTFQKMYIASHDSLRQSLDKEGHHIAEINVLQGSMSNLKSLIAGTDTALKCLQSIVNKNTLSATILLSATHNNGSTVTTVTAHDTVRGKDSTIYIYPQYKTSWNEKWSKGTIIANKDSIHRNFITFNDFELKQEWQKQKVDKKWFKQKVLVSSVKNLNPSTETINMKSFSLQAPKEHKLLTFGIGILAGSIGTIYLSQKLKK